jgi:quinol monooxygenase YgiN
MVKHIVVWKLKDDAEEGSKKDNALQVKRLLESLKNEIPGVINLEVGIDFSVTATSGDIVLYSEFADRAALEAYQAHPSHQNAAQLVRSVVSERRMVDYEI